MTNSNITPQDKKSLAKGRMGLLMGIFTLAVLCILPVVYDDYYFNILETKYQTYSIMAIAMMVIMLGYGLWTEVFIDLLKEFNIKRIMKSLNIADWSMLIFWFANVLSWIFCSVWRWEAFWGTSGRYNGVFLMTIYMVVYFMVTRVLTFRKWYLDAFLAIGIFVCLFGITDYFQMDLLGFKRNMVEQQKAIYTSTFGNINTYTIYVAAHMIIASILFAVEQCPKKQIWYYVNLVISCFALIMGCSDNAYLSLAALFGLSPLYLFKSKRGTSRYLVIMATFFTVVLAIAKINVAYAGIVYGIDSAFVILSNMSILPAIVLGLWIAAGGMIVYFKKNNRGTDEMCKWVSLAWIGVIVLVVSIVGFAFYDATILGNSARYGSLAPYVTFSESWGTNRGYVWIRAIQIWSEYLTPIQKLVGYGADTLGLIMRMYYPPMMTDSGPVVFDSAHNEYLHYLVTIGVLGMLAYISFLASSIMIMWKRVSGRPEVAAVMFAIVAYAVQAVVNINLPVAMPIILQLLAMGLSRGPEKENE